MNQSVTLNTFQSFCNALISLQLLQCRYISQSTFQHPPKRWILPFVEETRETNKSMIAVVKRPPFSGANVKKTSLITFGVMFCRKVSFTWLDLSLAHFCPSLAVDRPHLVSANTGVETVMTKCLDKSVCAAYYIHCISLTHTHLSVFDIC